ncbi:protein serine/threonine phosphatase 2C [Clathrospora elynae]|uniref:Protein serine/threonine phosphatase 2C n=1 Tax=Clathrospora elynae TaxID=706981 RepID=A0A6A5SMK6_9PLEO|nr:protein serine/threonine phosphatase 2C [Clathrospora elynae]
MSVNVVNVGVSRILGARQDQEDRYITLTPGTLKSRKDLAFFAVYDGHGGTEAVNHVEGCLVTYLEQYLVNPRATNAAEYKHAIQNTLKAVDQDLDREDLRGGSTVALALIDVKQGILIQSNLGDSHVVFADHEPQSPQSLSPIPLSRVDSITVEGWNVEVLSVEHSPDSPLEKRRVEDAGGEINYSSGIARIGAVSMSRALGDLEYKKPRVNRLAGHDLSDLIGVGTGLAPGKTATQDLVSNKPHFAVRDLHGQSLILLASDGVGDAKDAEEVTRLAVQRWQQGKEAKEIADELTQREGRMKGADNCTVMVVVLDTEGKGRRSIDGGRQSLDFSGIEGNGSRRRRRSSIASLKDWIRG